MNSKAIDQEPATVKERLVEYLKSKKVSHLEFSRRCGLGKSFVSSIRKSIHPGTLSKISESFPDLSIEWLMMGTGPMYAPQKPSAREERMVPLVPAHAYGGGLSYYTQPVLPEDCQMVASPVPGADLAVVIDGESMEPEYPNGATAFLMKYNIGPFIEWGRVFVLDTTNGAVLKRVTASSEEGCVRCESINPDPTYAPFDVPIDSILGMYRVVKVV